MFSESVYREHPKHPGFPKEIKALLKSGEAEDISWHNDTMPSVAKEMEDGTWVVLWVDYPEFEESLAEKEKEIDTWAEDTDQPELVGKTWDQLTPKQKEECRDFCIKYQLATHREFKGKQYIVATRPEGENDQDDTLETNDVKLAVAEFRKRVRELGTKK